MTTEQRKTIAAVWPDAALADEMLRRADAVTEQYGTFVSAHTLALLTRIRDLEAALQRRTELARALFAEFDGDVGHGIRNGYWPTLKALWQKARDELGITD